MEIFKILVLDDEISLVEELCDYLKMQQYQCFGAVKPTQAFEVLKRDNIDIAIIDVLLPDMNGLNVIKKIKQDYPLIEIIVVTGQGDMQTAIEAYRCGAIDFFSKPFSLNDLSARLDRVLIQLKLKAQAQKAELFHHLLANDCKEGRGFEFVGKSPEIQSVIELVSRITQNDPPTVLITGECGTGKELLARSIHAISSRSKNYFHSVNCSTIPESLLENEVFCRNKKEFPDFVEDTSGWFEISHNGTLFLNKINEMPLTTQGKIIRVLDNKVISRIGTNKEFSLNLRIIAATNKSIPKMVERGLFRSDLFHRLNTLVINIPSLRERREDIPDLIDYYLGYFNKSLNKNIRTVDEELVTKLKEYSFPGNVRELKNIIEQAMILCDSDKLCWEDVMINSNVKIQDNKVNVDNYELDKIEQLAVARAMKYAGLNKSMAARTLNISPQTLDNKLRKYHITDDMMS